MLHLWLSIVLAIVSGFVVLLACGLLGATGYFLHVFSRSHMPLNDVFDWGLPVTTPEPPLDFQRVLQFAAADGTQLCADFWAQTQPAPTIILCHGYRISRERLRPVAALQYARGYNVLLFDFRGHGESARARISAGCAEVQDLEAAIQLARQQQETLSGALIIHGFSMGAAVALLMPPAPDVAAIIADSPYARADHVILRSICSEIMHVIKRLPIRVPLLEWLTPAFAYLVLMLGAGIFRLFAGYSLLARPDHTLRYGHRRTARLRQKRHRTPLLLMHATGDEIVPLAHAHALATIASANGIPVETCFVTCQAHCGSYGQDPHRYNTALYRFLARHLGSMLPALHRG